MTDAADGRLTPLPPDQWDASLKPVLANLGTPLNIHNVIARHPALMLSYLDFRNHIVKTSSLSGRQRELLVLRTAHNTGAAYEWDHHVVRSRAIGMTDAEIERVRHGAGAAGWTAEEALLLKAADDIHRSTEIARPTWSAMCAAFSDAQLLDIVFTVGTYLIMSTILKTAQVPDEDDH
jgi:alkylhydroperoxidase family enzyme